MQVPNVHDAEPIPESARAAIEALLRSGDLFRYTAPEAAPSRVTRPTVQRSSGSLSTIGNS